MTADPYVIGRLTLTGADYRAKLHTTPNDDKPVQHISDHALRMFDRDYLAADIVNMSVSHISDQTLEAEIMRHRSTMAWLDVNQQKQKSLKLDGARAVGAEFRYVSATPAGRAGMQSCLGRHGSRSAHS